MIEILFKKFDENAVIPEKKHDTDAGFDLVATSCTYNSKYDRFEYGVGFATKIPSGFYAEILPRSSNTKTEAYLPNSSGVIDANYTGEWKVFYKLRTRFEELFPNGDKELNLLEMENELRPYAIGDKIAQCLIHRVEDSKFIVVDELPSTDRGADGGLIRDDKNFK